METASSGLWYDQWSVMLCKSGHVECERKQTRFSADVAGSGGSHLLGSVSGWHFKRFDGRGFKC